VLSPAVASAQSKVAVIDTERAVSQTEDGARAQATLKKLFDSRQAEIDAKQKTLQQQKDALEKEAAAGKTPKDALQRKADSLQKQYVELQQSSVNAQNEIQRKRSELTQPIVSKINTIVRNIATQEGYEVVIDKQAAPYFNPQLDLTDRAIKLYNAAPSAAPANPPPAAKKNGSPPAAPKK
jgi:outer membrane protein